MHARQILVFTLSFFLATTGPSFGASSSSPFYGLIHQHLEIKSGVGSMELLNKHGKNLADLTANFLGDPKNKKFIKTPEGLELQKHQQLLLNFLAVKNHFEKCVKGKEAKRKLHERVLQAGLQTITTTENALPCLTPDISSMNKDFISFNNDVIQAMKKLVKPDLNKTLSTNVITNTAKSLLAFRLKFHPDFMKNGVLGKKELTDLMNDVCTRRKTVMRGNTVPVDVCQELGKETKAELEKNLLVFAKTQKAEDKLTPEKATLSLNGAIDRLNTTLQKISVKNNRGYIYDSADLSNPQTKKEFDTYINQYMNEVSKEAGPLLLTKTMKDEAGSIKRLDDDETKKNKKNQFEFVPHKKIQIEDVKKSIKEAEEKMLAGSRTTLAIADNPQGDISEMVKINPFAAGQMLMKKPEYAGLVCDSINKINHEDVRDEDIDKYFTVGTAILGGALIVTGAAVMAPVAAAYVLTGAWTTTAIASGTIGGSILGYTALAGGALEIANATYYGKKSYDNYQEMNRLEAAYLTQNSDKEAVMEAKNALIEFKDARLSAGLSLAGAGLSFLGAGQFFNILKTSDAHISPGEISAAAKILKSIGETAVAKKLKDTAVIMGEVGAEKIDAFLLQLAKIGEASRLKFLDFLQTSKIVPEKIKTIIENSLEAAKNCK